MAANSDGTDTSCAEDAVRDDSCGDTAAKKDAVRDDSCSNNTAKEDAVRDDSCSDTTAKEDAVRDDSCSDNTAKEDAERNDSCIDTCSDTTAKEDAVRDDSCSDSIAQEDAARDDSCSDTTAKEDAARDDSFSDTTAKEDAVRDDSCSDTTAKEDAVRDDSCTDTTAKEDAVRDDSCSDTPGKEDAVRDDSCSDTPRKEDAERDDSCSDTTAKEDAARDDSCSDTPGKEDAERDDSCSDTTAKEDAVRDDCCSDSTAKEDAVRDDSCSDTIAKEDAARDDSCSDTTAKEDAVRDDSCSDSTAKEDAVRDDSCSDSTAKEDAARDDSCSDSTAKEDAARDDSCSDSTAKEDAVRDDSCSDSTAKEDAVRDDSCSDSTVKEDAVRDDSCSDTPGKEDAVRDDSCSDTLGKEDAERDDSCSDTTAKEDAVRDDSCSDSTVKEDAVRDDSCSDSTLKEDAVRDDSCSNTPGNEDAVRDNSCSDTPGKEDAVRDDSCSNAAGKEDVVRDDGCSDTPGKEDAVRDDSCSDTPAKEDAISSSAVKEEEGNGERKSNSPDVVVDSVCDTTQDVVGKDLSDEHPQDERNDADEGSLAPAVGGTDAEDNFSVDCKDDSSGSKQQKDYDNKYPVSSDVADGGCTSDELKDAGTELGEVGMATLGMSIDDVDSQMEGHFSEVDSADGVAKDSTNDAESSPFSDNSGNQADPGCDGISGGDETATEPSQAVKANQPDGELSLETKDKCKSESDLVDDPKSSSQLSDDSEATSELLQTVSENNTSSQLPLENVNEGEMSKTETTSVDEKIASEGVDTIKETDLTSVQPENDSSIQDVKGHSGDSETSKDKRNENHEIHVVTASVKPVLIFPNPDPETEASTAEVFSNKNEMWKEDAQTRNTSSQVDAGNANNNAKGQSARSSNTNQNLLEEANTKPVVAADGRNAESSSSKSNTPMQDTKERAGKSYSAQRSAIRGNRKAGASDTKLPDKQTTPKLTIDDGKTELKGRLGQEEVTRVKGKQATDHGRDKTSGSNRPRDVDRESDRKHADRRDRRDRDGRDRDGRDRDGRDRDGRDKRSQETGSVIKKPVKTKEEIEREEAERQRKEEEQRKTEEEKKAAEMKRQEEEEQRLLEEENVRLAEEEQKHAVEISAEATDRKHAKMALRAKNLAAPAERPDEDFFVKLDSSMKKNTAFVRKLKTMTEQQRDSLTSDFNGLNLTKYVGEVATAIVESKFKMADIACAVYVCSLVHQRYAEFSSHLLQAIQKCHPAQTRKDEQKDAKKEPVVFDNRIRVELRFLAELIVAGVFTEKEGLPALNTLLSSILKADKESHAHVSIIISFLKHCGEDFAGLVPRRNRLLAEKFNLTLPSSEIFSAQRKSAYKGLLKEHYLSLTKHLLKEHRELQNLEKHNRRILQTKGELSEDRRKRHDEMQSSFQKLLVNTSTYADLIDEVVPDLPEAEITQEEREMMALDYLGSDKSGAEFDFDTSLWEDEDTRTFHESLIDLRTMVPGILFKDSEKTGTPDEKQEELDKLGEDIVALEQTEGTDVVTKEEADAAETGPSEEPEGTTEEEMTVEDVEATSTSEPEQEDTEEEEEETEQVTNMSKKMLLDVFLQRLPQCVNRDFIDKAAVEFCMDLNTKINRRKLIKALFNVPRTRLDLLSFYSRLVATLYPCMPDIGTELVEKLKADFRWHVRKKDQMMIETKIKTVRFIGELTKFRMCPKSDTLQCVKFLLQDFRHHNIDMVCNLLDSCGRFLYRSSDSHLLTKALLELMMRKRNKLHLIERHSTMVENTFFYCNPPEVKQSERKERPVIHQYIRKLIYRDLSKTTTEKVLKQLRKMDWNNMEIKTYITKCLSNVWNVKFNNIHCVASLLAGLVPYHDDVGIQVVDAILEDIRIGMEINHAKFNQRRVSIVKFLGELYNYRMVESAVVFKTLYSLIRFGITLDGAENPLDPPEHLFRLRLVCTLLDTCGQFFDRGTSKKKLDCFLVYFQQYIMYKRSLPIWNPQLHPFPLDNDNALADTLETMRPKMEIHTTLEAANEAVAELEKEQIQKYGGVIQMALASVNSQQQGPQQLGTITEGDETRTSAGLAVEFTSITEDEEISDSDSESEGVSRRGGRGSGEGHASNSQSQGYSQNTGDEEGGDDNMALDSAGETEEDDTVTVLTGGPKLIKCEEDDVFTTDFDKMLSDSVQQRTVDTIKVPQQDIAIPAHARPRPKKMTYDIFNPDEDEDDDDNEQMESVNFVLMMRRGNKQHYHEFEVPKSSELAANLRNREKLELAEKQRLKELTLNINDRQEEEDYQEMMAQFQKPATVVTPVVPKERKPRFHHPKGAPNADQIFNSSGNRKW